jgi:hypothetical protein
MTRRKPKATPQTHSKTRTHALADGWTQVLRGPPPRNPGLSTPSVVPPSPGSTLTSLRQAYSRVEEATRNSDFNVEVQRATKELTEKARVGARAAEGDTATVAEGKRDPEAGGEVDGTGEVVPGASSGEESRTRSEGKSEEEAVKEHEGSWADDVDGLEGQLAGTHLHNTTPAPSTQPQAQPPTVSSSSIHLSSSTSTPFTPPHPHPYPFTSIILLALGSPSHPSREISRVSLTQLSTATSLLALLLSANALAPDAPRLVQDPSFNALDKRFLAELGWTVVESPAAEHAVGQGSVLIAPHLEEAVLKQVLARWGEPASGARGIMLGNDLGAVQERIGTGGRGDGTRGSANKTDRWWEGWQSRRFDAARDSVGAREWFGVALHWRGLDGDADGAEGGDADGESHTFRGTTRAANVGEDINRRAVVDGGAKVEP